MSKKTVLRAILLVFLLPIISIEADADDITSNLICPCECAMVISTCDCPTALQIKKEIASMKGHSFSEAQIFSALQAEYGKEILPHEKIKSIPFWIAGIPLALILVFVGYVMRKKPKLALTPEGEKYENQFEEEYKKFVSEIEEI